ncbi:MAG: ferrochelatase [Myxococcus sp.]|nr:ferrochelatase [Myxococcus sp.]
MNALTTTPKKRRAVVLVNLGTPSAPTPGAVRAYLREFLSDPRVVDLHPVARWVLLNLVILPRRPGRVAPLYQSIWMEDGSPLLVHGRALERQVQALLPDAEVVLAMRYGAPSLTEALERIDGLRLRDVTVVPLFPHEASATTGSVREAVYTHYRGHPRVPSVRVVPPFFDDAGYLEALAENVRGQLPGDVQHVLFSYHGLPERQVRREDGTGQCLAATSCCAALTEKNAHCYRAQCFATTRAIAAKLGLGDVSTSFQSRLGRDPWIGPATDAALEALVERGVTRVAVVTPGFVADCLETLEELGKAAVERFHQRGGQLTVVRCLNDDPTFARVIARLTDAGARRHA